MKTVTRDSKSIFKIPWISILIGVIALSVLLAILQPAFVSAVNFKNILLQASFTAIIAVGMTFVIMSGGIDISVGMNVFMTMSVICMVSNFMPPWAALLIGLLCSLLVGVVNGVLICTFRIEPMIATLATLSICRGVAFLLIDSKMKVADEAVRVVGMTEVFGVIPLPIVLVGASAVIGWFLHKYTRFGRYVLAIGNSTVSARETGIDINKIRFATYVLCALFTGIAAMVYLGRLGVVQTDSAYGTEFTVITAVVLGGTSLAGGKGTVIGSVIGCIFLTLIENGLTLNEISGYYYDIVRGCILFAAVAIDAFSNYRQRNKLLEQHGKRLRERNAAQ